MANLFDKVLNFVGWETEEGYEDEYEPMEQMEEDIEQHGSHLTQTIEKAK